jgi:hypothetical protein
LVGRHIASAGQLVAPAREGKLAPFAPTVPS